MELLFNNVHLELESRPRSSSSRISISLGSVILNDYLTENSIFPVLISPQSKLETIELFFLFEIVITNEAKLRKLTHVFYT